VDRDERGLVEDVISANLISVEGEVKQGVAGDLRLNVPRSVVPVIRIGRIGSIYFSILINIMGGISPALRYFCSYILTTRYSLLFYHNHLPCKFLLRCFESVEVDAFRNLIIVVIFTIPTNTINSRTLKLINQSLNQSSRHIID